MRPFAIAGVIAVIAGVSTVSGQQPDRTLLTTRDLAREIRELQGPRADAQIDARALKARVARMRQAVGNFIVRQIQVYPSIEQEDLQKQLGAAFGSWPGPRVFALPWGPKTSRRIFVVTYGWFGFYGRGGSETILESYIWDKDRGGRFGAGLIPAALSGFLTEQEKVCWFPDPDTYWVLVSGLVGGGSGRVIGGTAAVFEIGPEQVKAVWNAPPLIGNIGAYVPPSGVPRWEMVYVDVKKFYDNHPSATIFDMYQVDYANRTFRRVIHQPLD